MGKRKRFFGALLIAAALVVMTLPVSEADAASSASDFVMEGNKLVKYRGTETNVSVPDTVEIIGENAFEDNTKVELVVLPNSVRRIEGYAFWGCDKLDTVVLGKGLTEVGDYAFAGCGGLQQISLPSNVTSVGIQAFGDCVNLTDITIPAETVEIDESAFVGCAKLKIHCQTGSVADAYAQKFYERQKEMAEYEDVPAYDQNTVSPSPSASPAASASPEPTLTPTPTPEPGMVLGSTQVVGNRAVVFVDAAGLEAKLGEEAGVGALDGEALLQQTLPAAQLIRKYTIVDGRTVADQAYYRSDALDKVELPHGVEEIGQFSFARSSMTAVTVPEGVKRIGYGAFYHCDSLAEVTLPDTVENVEPKAFAKTAWVESFLQDDTADDFLISGGVLVAYRGDSAEVTVPDGVRVIAAEAFARHSEIEQVTLPDSIRVIGEAAFENCTGIRKVILPEGLEQVKDRAFNGDINAEIRVPASVKEQGLKAFEGASVAYAGEQPAQSYEDSATRLSNAVFRGTEEDTGDGEVRVMGTATEGAAAALSGAAAQYKLTISRLEESPTLQTAWDRAMDTPLPEKIQYYGLELTDNSKIPIKKLGRQLLTVELPLPEELVGLECHAVTCDRNGQLEAVACEKVLVNGKESVCIQTSHLSDFAIYSTGAEDTEALQEMEFSLQAAAPAMKETETGRTAAVVKMATGALLLAAGVVLLGCGCTAKKGRP